MVIVSFAVAGKSCINVFPLMESVQTVFFEERAFREVSDRNTPIEQGLSYINMRSRANVARLDCTIYN